MQIWHNNYISINKKDMKVLAILLFTCIAVLSCNNHPSTDHQNGENKDQKPNPDSTTNGTLGSGCYMRVLQRDSLTANLKRNADRVSGNLRFDNFEKDGSSGTVNGVIKDNIIKLIYTFQSEGMTSVMEVYFKTDGDNLIRGIGEMETKNDTVSFKNPDAVQYPANEKWAKVACSL